jgi:hypothetical protein
MLELLKSLKFLQAVCFMLEALVVQFAPQVALPVGALLLAVVAVLNLFGIQPELRMRALLKAEDLRLQLLKKGKK